MDGYRIYQGETVGTLVISSVAAELDGWARIRYDNGRDDTFKIPVQTTGATRAIEALTTGHVASYNGYVVEYILRSATTLRRGQCYTQTAIGPKVDQLNAPVRQIISSDYIYDFYAPTLGVFHEPTSGRGHRQVLAVADDVTPVDITLSLAATNALRKVYGFSWYYECSGDVADRTMRPILRQRGGGLPTNFAAGNNAGNWFGITTTVSANEQGAHYAYGEDGQTGYEIAMDNGAATTSNTTTSPAPFPFWVSQDDIAHILFDVGAAEAADRHSIWLFLEEWIEG